MIQRTYSTFRPLDVLICSWNVDAARPDTLTGSHKPENYNFLKNLLSSETDDGRRPDIIVFGFQEVIDLEDKKLTASECLKGMYVVVHFTDVFLQRRFSSDGKVARKIHRPFCFLIRTTLISILPPKAQHTYRRT